MHVILYFKEIFFFIMIINWNSFLDRMNPFTAMSDDEFVQRFRLRKHTLHNLIEEITNQLPTSNDTRGEYSKFISYLVLFIVLYLL